ncbi:acid protease [Westerdykella ornata]|uniref:Acid protease n=1 Tax=Westerdykella ornata TaxID=318751 RepID=A0A6A6J8W9_WESOR|nr:acid protease [Westerdykella ornata]KAF2271649.1 acid protease [Westerdykella ornata]
MEDSPWLRVLPKVALLVLALSALVLAADETTTPLGKPINVQPSQYWDGKDGPWSTFRIEVGDPPQQIRVLPASSQSSSWLVLPEACAVSRDAQCTDHRGKTYKRNESSTWKEFGSYNLNTFLQQRLGLNGDGLYGYEKVTLGWAGDGLPSVDGVLVAGMVSDDFYLGSLALSPRPNNFTDFNNPIPSLMRLLRNASTPIPSSSWSYTAGSHNLAPKVFGSLVLGGYDSTRFEPNNVVFPFGADISLEFQVAIQEITTNVTDKPLLSTGIISYIDTLVPDIWLPNRTCALFEEAFGLVWDTETELYLLNDELHESLLEKNPTVEFKVGPQLTGDAVTISLPYFNWYQTATTALTGNKSGLYFPLKRAANETQYVLGRTFLQSAYLSADYGRNSFNLSQALYPSSSTSANVLPIFEPRNHTQPPGGQNSDSGGSSKLSTGAIAGIAVGAVVVVALIAALIIFLLRRKRAKKVEETHELADTDMQHSATHEVPGEDLKYEVGDGLRHEVTGDSSHRIELSAVGKHEKPLEMEAMPREIYEMEAIEAKTPVELEGEGHVHEKSPGMASVTPAASVAYTEDDETPLSPQSLPRGQDMYR